MQLIKIHPITREKTFCDLNEGDVLGEVLRSEYGNQKIQVALQNNGENIPVDLEHSIAKNDLVVAYPVVEGSNDILRSVALMALVMYAGPAAGALAGAQGTFAYAAASMATVVAGQYIINQALPPTMPDTVENRDPLYSIVNGQNSANIGGSLPVVLGKTRMLPNLGAKPWTERQGNDEVLNVVLHWGFDPEHTTLSDIRIGDTALADLNGTIEYSNSSGKLASELNVDTLNGGTLEDETSELTWTSEDDTKKMSLHLDYRLGRVNSSGKFRDEDVYFTVLYRKDGTSNWSVLTVEDAPLFWGSHTVSSTEFNGDNSGSTTTTTVVKDAPTQTWLNIEDHSHEQKRISLDFEFPSSDTWEVQIRRRSAKSSKRHTRDLSVSRILFYNEYDTPAETKGQLRTLIRVPASEAVSGTISKITGLVSRKSYIFGPNTTAAWLEHSNPAWWFLHMASGWSGGSSNLLYGGGVHPSKIDYEKIEEWAAWCDANNLKINYIFNSQTNGRDALERIARVGRARIDTSKGLLSVIYDEEAQPFSFTIDKNDVIEDSVSVAYSANEVPDQLVASIMDEDDDYNLTEVTVQNPEVSSVVTSNPVQLPGVTSVIQAKEELHYIYAESIYRNSRLTLDVELPALLMSEGEIVSVANDVHMANGSGYRNWKVFKITVSDAEKHLYTLELFPETPDYYNAKNGDYDHTKPDWSDFKPKVVSSSLVEKYDFHLNQSDVSIGWDAVHATKFKILIWIDDRLTYNTEVEDTIFRFNLKDSASVRWAIAPYFMHGDYVSVKHTGSGEVKGIEGIDPIVPFVPKPVGLGAGTPDNPEDTFVGKDARIYWRPTRATIDDDADLDNAFVDDTSGELITSYEVTVYNGDNEVRTEVINGHEYIYTYEKNLEDNGTPIRDFKFSVVALGPRGSHSDQAYVYCANPAPAIPSGISVKSAVEGYQVSHLASKDVDYAGTLIWASTDPDFSPSGNEVGSGNCVARGVNSSFVFNGITPDTYYIRLAAFDVFDDEVSDLEVSGSHLVEVFPIPDPVYVTPSKVTGVELSQSLSINEDGTATASVTVTWDAVSDELTHYSISVDGIEFQSGSDTTYSFPANPGTDYIVKVRAINISAKGTWSNNASITVSGDNNPPALVSGTTLTASFRNVFIEWTIPSDKDYSHTEVYRSTVDNFAQASLAGSGIDSFTDSKLATGTTYYYWFKSVDLSGNKSSQYPTGSGNSATTQKLATVDYTDLSITNGKIANLAVDTAKIANLAVDTAKIKDLAVTTAKVSEIDASKITVSGSTNLSDWRKGGDITKIDGGKISANTVATNQLSVGNRNILLDTMTFTPDAATNTLSWTNGWMNWGGDNEAKVSKAVSAGSVQWTSGTIYIYWIQNSSVLSTSTNPEDAYGQDRQPVGIYKGGGKFSATMGRTIIDGDSIQTGSIKAEHISATDLIITNSLQIGDQIITTESIKNGAVTSIAVSEASSINVTGTSSDTAYGTTQTVVELQHQSENVQTLFNYSGFLTIGSNANRKGMTSSYSGSRIIVRIEQLLISGWQLMAPTSVFYRQLLDVESNHEVEIPIALSLLSTPDAGVHEVRIRVTPVGIAGTDIIYLSDNQLSAIQFKK